MELSWLSRLRLTLVIAVGVVLLAMLAGPFVQPADPLAPVTILRNGMSVSALLALVGLALASGFVAYFLAWPYGREMAIVAAPAGLAAIAVHGGNLANLFQMHPAATERAAAYAMFRWEGFIWLAIVVAGIAGSMIAWFIRRPSPESRPNAIAPEDAAITRAPATIVNVILAMCMATAIAYIGLMVFVKGVPTPTGSGYVSSQPMTVQIAAGAIIAFGLAAFATKKVFNFGWSITLAATGIVNFGAMTLAGNPTLLSDMATKYPAATFAQTPFAVLPIQLIAFGAIGAVMGYWMAVRYNVWRKEVKVI